MPTCHGSHAPALIVMHNFVQESSESSRSHALRGNAVKARCAASHGLASCVYGTQRVRHCIPTQRVGTRLSRRHLCIKTSAPAWKPVVDAPASRIARAMQTAFPRRSVGTIQAEAG